MKRGEVWLTDFGAPSGPEQAGSRPAIILQSDDLTPIYATVVVVPLTTNLKRLALPTTVLIPEGEAGLPKDSVALCHQVQVRGKVRLGSLVGELSPDYMDQVEQTVLTAIGM